MPLEFNVTLAHLQRIYQPFKKEDNKYWDRGKIKGEAGRLGRMQEIKEDWKNEKNTGDNRDE